MSKEQKPPRKPGRPKSAAARAAALQAARALIEEAGPNRLTVEAVAARAGVGKPTIYRHWANAQELAMAALMSTRDATGGVDAKKTPPLVALERLLEDTARRLASREGRQTALMLASAEQDGELFKLFRNRVLLDGRRRAVALLEAAIEVGDLRADIDAGLAVDLVFGALFLRVLLRHAPLEPGFAAAALRLALDGARPRPAR